MNNLQISFKENDIPYDSLKKLGISKMDIFSMEKTNLESFLSGRRTNLFNIKGNDLNGEEFSFKGKLSLYKKDDGSTGLNIHPIRTEINNDINLKGEEIEKLKGGLIIEKMIDKQKTLIQLDKETNELLKTKVKDISIPSHIQDVELNSSQKELLKHGQPIALGLNSGKDTTYLRIDLNSVSGLKFSKEDFELKNKLAFDRANPQIVGHLQTDRNQAEYVEYHKSHGVKPNNDTGDNHYGKKQNNDNSNKLKI